MAQQHINRSEWDALITRSPQRQVYALSWYLDIVATTWDAIVAIDAQGKYAVVMPVPWRKKLGMRYVQQPLFCQQLGLYSTAETIEANIYEQFLAEVRSRFRYVAGYQFNTGNQLPKQAGRADVVLSQTFTLYLELKKGYEQLYQGYTRDRKINLKRAQRALLQLQESDDPEPVITFFKAETADRIYGGVAEKAYDTLRLLFAALQERGLVRLFYTVDAEGRKNAGCMFIIWQGRIVYIYNAAAGYGRKLNGRTLLLDFVIREYAGRDFIFDFESPDEREPDIVHFYSSFGAEPASMAVLQYNHLPRSIKWLRAARMRLIRKMRGLPHP